MKPTLKKLKAKHDKVTVKLLQCVMVKMMKGGPRYWWRSSFSSVMFINKETMQQRDTTRWATKSKEQTLQKSILHSFPFLASSISHLFKTVMYGSAASTWQLLVTFKSNWSERTVKSRKFDYDANVIRSPTPGLYISAEGHVSSLVAPPASLSHPSSRCISETRHGPGGLLETNSENSINWKKTTTQDCINRQQTQVQPIRKQPSESKSKNQFKPQTMTGI